MLINTNKIKNILRKAIKNRQFPGCCLGIFLKDTEYFINLGKLTYSPLAPDVTSQTFYDLASLTKPLATTLCIINLISRDLLSLESKVEDFFNYRPKDKSEIKIKHLLSHTSGFPAIPELWKISENNKTHIIKSILETPLEFNPATKTLYSDFGFILLGLIIEKITGLNLEIAISKFVFEPFDVNEIMFAPRIAPSFIAPTQFFNEESKFLWGEPDDRNARFLDGVAGHAGLFGSVRGVLELLKKILFIYKGEAKLSGFPRELLRIFFKRALIDPGSSWALGFDTPSGVDSTAGRYFSQNSIGHLGYTGASFWMDLEREIIIVFLSNRVFPVNTEENKKNMKVFRHDLHNLIMEELLNIT